MTQVPHSSAFEADLHRASEPTPVPTTTSQDLLAAALAALMPLGAGLLMLLGWALLGVFGVILGLGGSFWWGYWWRTKHQAFFPTDLRGGSVGGIAVLVALIGIFFASSLA